MGDDVWGFRGIADAECCQTALATSASVAVLQSHTKLTHNSGESSSSSGPKAEMEIAEGNFREMQIAVAVIWIYLVELDAGKEARISIPNLQFAIRLERGRLSFVVLDQLPNGQIQQDIFAAPGNPCAWNLSI